MRNLAADWDADSAPKVPFSFLELNLVFFLKIYLFKSLDGGGEELRKKGRETPHWVQVPQAGLNSWAEIQSLPLDSLSPLGTPRTEFYNCWPGGFLLVRMQFSYTEVQGSILAA